MAEGPKRDVELRISPHEFFSEIADPPGAITPSEVISYEVVEKRRWRRSSLYYLYVDLTHERRVHFYTAQSSFDLALVLDELEAARPDVPRFNKTA